MNPISSIAFLILTMVSAAQTNLVVVDSVARARLCASLLSSTGGRALDDVEALAAIDEASARVAEVERHSAFSTGPDLRGRIKKIYRILTAPVLGHQPFVVDDVTRPDEGSTKREAVTRLGLATAVGDALTMLATRKHLYARRFEGKDEIGKGIGGILGAAVAQEMFHAGLIARRKAAPKAPPPEIPEPLVRPDLPLWGRTLALGAAVGASAGLGYLIGAQLPPRFFGLGLGLGLASGVTGWIAIRDAAFDFGYRTLLKYRIWREGARERSREAARERHEENLERADAQVETFRDFIRLAARPERDGTFAYYGFDTELPLHELSTEPGAVAEAIEKALQDPDHVVAGPRRWVRVELVLYFADGKPKLLTFVNPVPNPYLNVPTHVDLIGVGFAM